MLSVAACRTPARGVTGIHLVFHVFGTQFFKEVACAETEVHAQRNIRMACTKAEVQVSAAASVNLAAPRRMGAVVQEPSSNACCYKHTPQTTAVNTLPWMGAGMPPKGRDAQGETYFEAGGTFLLGVLRVKTRGGLHTG
eukprot:scaffold56405_cov20-Tisochrysis_lutea.AAC.1